MKTDAETRINNDLYPVRRVRASLCLSLYTYAHMYMWNYIYTGIYIYISIHDICTHMLGTCEIYIYEYSYCIHIYTQQTSYEIQKHISIAFVIASITTT